MAKVAADAFNLNMIAKSHDNYAGLTNIELIKVDRSYFPRVIDYPLWRDGISRVDGDGIARDDGYSSTSWQTGGITFAQWWYLYTTILDGHRSGPVTIKTRKWAYPVNTTMSERYVIANATLTLPPPPDIDARPLGYPQFVYQFSRIEILHEDTMRGLLKLDGGAAAIEDVTTTPELLTVFDTDGIADGMTVSNSGDSITAIIAGQYEAMAIITFTGTASKIFTFQFYVDGAAEGTTTTTTTNATPDAEQAVLFTHLDLAAAEVVTIYVNSADAGAGTDITVTEARFGLHSI